MVIKKQNTEAQILKTGLTYYDSPGLNLKTVSCFDQH